MTQTQPWPYRYFIAVPAESLADASNMAATIDPDTGGEDSFTIALSAHGDEPATHWATNTLATESIVAMLAAVVGLVAGNVWWRVDSQTFVLQATNCQPSEARIGHRCTFAEAMADAGFVRLREPWPA